MMLLGVGLLVLMFGAAVMVLYFIGAVLYGILHACWWTVRQIRYEWHENQRRWENPKPKPVTIDVDYEEEELW